MTERRDLGPPFAALLRASFITNLGDGLRLAALPLLATTLTSSALLVSALTAAQYLPWIVWAPVGGVIVDRSDRRRLIVVTQTWRAALVLALGVAVVADVAAMWHLLVVAFAITVGEILVDPSVVAIVPQLVAPGDLDRANGRLNTVEIATNDFAGRTLGAIAFGFAPWVPLIADGLTYGGSVGWFARLPEPTPADPGNTDPGNTVLPERSVRREIGAGLAWLRAHTFLWPMTTATALFHVGTGGTLAVLVLLVTDELGLAPWLFGMVLAAGALGAAVASPTAAGLAERSSRRAVVTTAALLIGATVIGAAVAGSAGWLLALWFLNGVGVGLFHSIGRGFIQRHTPDRLLGRTAIASRMITRGTFVVAALGIGAIADQVGIRWALCVAGGFHLAGGAGVWSALRDHPNA